MHNPKDRYAIATTNNFYAKVQIKKREDIFKQQKYYEMQALSSFQTTS